MVLGSLQEVSFQYAGRNEYALSNVNFSFRQGEIILFIGSSGSGKSTLLNVINGMIPYFYKGNLSGQIIYKGKALTEMPKNIGTVFQEPHKQLVYGTVLKELVFGMENIGLCASEMRKRLGELVSFLGIEDLLDKQTEQLSGGEKQLICIGSILAMRPEVLILDEPTAQLDPTSAEKIFSLIKRLNEELGITVLLSEQRIDKCYNFADQIVYLEKGRIIRTAAPKEMAIWQVKKKKDYVPALTKLFAAKSLGVPLSVKEGKQALEKINLISCLAAEKNKINDADEQESLSLNQIGFAYEKNKRVLKKIDLRINKGEFIILAGANGAGKTTLIKIIAGLLKPSEGRIRFKGEKLKNINSISAGLIGYLPQHLNHYFFKESVREELLFNAQNVDKIADLEKKISKLICSLELDSILDCNPRELSMGEQQKTALAAVLAAEPEIIVLDEPTKGLDQKCKRELGEILTSLSASGITLIVVTHDLEFAADYGKRMVIMFQGEIVTDGPLEEILQNNWFYTTQLSLVFRGKTTGVINYKDALRVLEEKDA